MAATGSSMYSAHLAAAKGCRMCSPTISRSGAPREALAIYRDEFRPSDLCAEPVTFLTVNASVAPTREGSRALLLPNLCSRWRGTGSRSARWTSSRTHRGLRRPAGTAHHRRRGENRDRGRAAAAGAITFSGGAVAVDRVMVPSVAAARQGTDPATARRARDNTGTAQELFWVIERGTSRTYSRQRLRRSSVNEKLLPRRGTDRDGPPGPAPDTRGRRCGCSG